MTLISYVNLLDDILVVIMNLDLQSFSTFKKNQIYLVVWFIHKDAKNI